MIVDTLKRLWRDRTAATAVEYGLIMTLVVISMLAALMGLANTTTGMWNNVQTKVATATNGG